MRAMSAQQFTRGQLLYEGKAKRMYATQHPAIAIMEFKDSLTAFDAEKRAEVAGKGALNCAINTIMMERLGALGIDTNFVRQLDSTSCAVRKCEIVPLEVIVRFSAWGSLCRRYGIKEGSQINPPLLEIGYKNDALHDPFLSDDIAALMGLATRDELAQIRYMALSTGIKLKEIYAGSGITLHDFKLEFGRWQATDPSGKPLGSPMLLLADEVTPDTCRLVDAKSGEKYDKDLFRFDLGDISTGYGKLLARLQGRS
jgi:phosphoribosylaminoimidazole-succinocarboxamide synthase